MCRCYIHVHIQLVKVVLPKKLNMSLSFRLKHKTKGTTDKICYKWVTSVVQMTLTKSRKKKNNYQMMKPRSAQGIL